MLLAVPFKTFGASHLTTLLITAIISFTLIVLTRRSEKIGKSISYFWGALLFLNYIFYFFYRINLGQWDLRYDLPMEFCNWAAIALVMAHFTFKPFLLEICYYFVFAGSLQGLLTPDLGYDFPHPYFFVFMIGHAGLIIGTLQLLVGFQILPRPNSALRVFYFGLFYFGFTLLLNWFLDSNYGYLMHKPAGSSLLDYLGPWPWYLASLLIIALIFFQVMYLPIWLIRRHQEKSRGNSL